MGLSAVSGLWPDRVLVNQAAAGVSALRASIADAFGPPAAGLRATPPP
jgi:hypothetical protein